MSEHTQAKVTRLPRAQILGSGDRAAKAEPAINHADDATPSLMQLLAALSDTELYPETYAWFKGQVRSVGVLRRRLGVLLPDHEPVARTPQLAAWASRDRSVSIVYWIGDGELDVTIDQDVDVAVRVITDDIVACAQARAARSDRAAAASRSPSRSASGYGLPVDEPVVTRVVAVEDLPLGSPASRRIIAAWSDGTESEALAWLGDEWLVSEGDLVGRTRAEIRSLAHRRDARWLSDDPPASGSTFPFFES